MKNSLILFLILILFCGCNKDETKQEDFYKIGISSSTMIFEAQKDTCFFDILFTRNNKKEAYYFKNLKVNIPENWCKFRYTEANLSNSYICIIAEPNTDNTDRAQTIRFSYIDEIRNINIYTDIEIRQRGGVAATFINLASDTLVLKTKEPNIGINIESNGVWHIKNVPEWCTIEPLSGNGNQYVRISRTKESFKEKKEANFIISFSKEKTLHLELWNNEEAFIYIPSDGLSDFLWENDLYTTIKYLKLKGPMKLDDFYTLKKISNLRSLDLSQTYIYDQTATIPSFGFSECSLLESIIFPRETLALRTYAFFKCISLKEILIPEKTIKISDHTFNACTDLKKIKLPSTVQIIENSAFQSCPLNEVTIKAITPPKLNAYAFNSGTYETATLLVPKGCKSKYMEDINWGKFRNIVEIL